MSRIAAMIVRRAATTAKLLFSNSGLRRDTTAAGYIRALCSRSPSLPCSEFDYGIEARTHGNRTTSQRSEERYDEDGAYFRLDVPGFARKHVRVSLIDDSLVIAGNNDEELLGGRSIGIGFQLPCDPSEYNWDEMKITVEHGVARVYLPKCKNEV